MDIEIDITLYCAEKVRKAFVERKKERIDDHF